MTNTISERLRFADFLKRIADGQSSVEDWNACVATHYTDAATERARVILSRKAMGLQQCSGCLVPPGLESVAQELREQLLEAP